MAAVALRMARAKARGRAYARSHTSIEDDSEAPSPTKRKYQGAHEGLWQYQTQMESFYCNPKVEYSVALLIVLNFIINIWEKQVDPTGFGSDPDARLYVHTWNLLSDLFNYAFLLELIVNMYAFWFWDFWCDPWNVFDFVVVVLGVVSLLR